MSEASSPWERFIISISAAERMLAACERDLPIVRDALAKTDDPAFRAECRADEAELVAKIRLLTDRIERQREYNRERARKQYQARKAAATPATVIRQRAAERKQHEAAERQRAREAAEQQRRQRRIEQVRQRLERYRALLETNPKFYRYQISRAERTLAELTGDGVAGRAAD